MAENARTNIDTRIQELESVTATLSADGKSTRADIEKLTVAFDRFSQSVSQWMQNSGRTNWGVFAGFGTLLLAVGALAASPFMRDLDRMEGDVNRMEEAIILMGRDRYTEDDALTETRRLETRMDSSVSTIDETLQREMRLLDDALQREMRMLLDAPIERLKAVEGLVTTLQEELKERQAWMAEHDRNVSALNATQNVRIEAVEAIALGNQEDLASRSGRRFNRDDYDKYVLPRLDYLRNRVDQAEAELARRISIIDRIEAEQNRRHDKVYKP